MEQKSMNYWVKPGISFDFNYVQGVVAENFNTTREEMKKRSRKIPVREPRQVCLFLGYAWLGLGGDFVVRQMGLKNHATAIHSCKVVRRLYEVDKSFRGKLNNILESLALDPVKFQYLLS